MKVKGILAICCSVCLTACGGRGTVPQLVEVAPPTVSVSDADVALPRWNLKTDYSEKFFEEAVDSMRFILLETTDASMLGVIDQVQKIGDKLVAVLEQVSANYAIWMNLVNDGIMLTHCFIVKFMTLLPKVTNVFIPV